MEKDESLVEFMDFEFKSKARIVDNRFVEVIAPDGEKFTILSDIGKYINEASKRYQLHVLESIFDKIYFDEGGNYCNDRVWFLALQSGVSILGVSSSNGQKTRERIGAKIRKIREERGMEARELAKLAGVDSANLSRIENGRYSVGLDILSKIAM